jgi:hypothetical protein
MLLINLGKIILPNKYGTSNIIDIHTQWILVTALNGIYKKKLRKGVSLGDIP